MSALIVEKLDVYHGLLAAVRGVDLTVEGGETMALVGANGAGKTTLLRAIAGGHAPTSGRVLLDGEDVTKEPAHLRVRRGIALVPEGRRLFPHLTVEENLRVGGTAGRPGLWTLASVLEALPILAGLLRKRAGFISGGEQQATAIGRALMSNPGVLLLDELSLGLSPIAVDTVYESLSKVIASGTAVILVEQDLERAMAVATHLTCMLEGRVVLQGRRAEFTRPQIVSAFFGLERSPGGLES